MKGINVNDYAMIHLSKLQFNFFIFKLRQIEVPYVINSEE